MTSYVPWFAMVSATSWLIALATIALFFAIGQPWGTVNDIASLTQWAAAIPLVLVVWTAQRDLGLVAVAVAGVGVVSLVVACGLTILLLVQVLSFAQQGTPTAVAGGAFGAWLVLAALLLAGRSPLPNPLLATMALAGLGTMIGVLGFVEFGPSHWLTYVGGAVGGLAYPIWGYWLAILLMRSPHFLS